MSGSDRRRSGLENMGDRKYCRCGKPFGFVNCPVTIGGVWYGLDCCAVAFTKPVGDNSIGDSSGMV